MRRRQLAVSHSSSSLNGLFKEVYEKRLVDLIPASNVVIDRGGGVQKRRGISLFDINKATYNLWNNVSPSQDYQVLVHPDTYNKLLEDTMGQYGEVECSKVVDESPTQKELNHLKYTIKDLRASIARKQEQLRIEMAKLAAVKKLAKGGK